MDYKSPLQDDYGSGNKPSYGGRYAPYTQRRVHPDSKINHNTPPYYPDHRGSSNNYGPMTVQKYPDHPGSSNNYGPMTVQKYPDHPGSSNNYGPMTVQKYGDRHKPARYPPELTAQFGANECKLCSVQISSPIMGKMHYAGKVHSKKVKSFLLEWSNKTGAPMPELNELQTHNETNFPDYCDICDVRMTGASDKILHYSGKNHKKNELNPANARKKKKCQTVDLSGRFGIGGDFSIVMQASENELEGAVKQANDFKGAVNNAFVCELCNVTAVSQDQLNKHLEGKKHKEKFDKSMSNDPKKDRPFKCTICDVALETKSLLKLHFKGKRHSKTKAKMDMIQNTEDTINSSSYPKELTDLFDNMECKLCGAQLVSYSANKAHYSGKQHMKKVNNFMIQWYLTKGSSVNLEMNNSQSVTQDSGSYDFEICEVRLPSYDEKLKHNKDEMHLQALVTKGKDMIGEGFSPQEPAREIEMEEIQLNRNLSKNMQNEELEKKPSSVSKDLPFTCSICDVYVETKYLLQSHLLGEEHNKNVMEKGASKEDLQDSFKCQYCDFVGEIKRHVCKKSPIETEIEGLKNKWVCRFCNGIKFNCELEYKEHKNTDRHILSVLNNEEKGDEMINDLSHFYCLLCKKQSYDLKEYTSHLFGEKHMSLTQENPVLGNDLYRCTVCHLTMTQELKEQHLLDRKHIKESIKKDTLNTLVKLANEDIGSLTYNCENCGVGPLNFLQYSHHVLGNTHLQVMIHAKLCQLYTSTTLK